MKRFMRLLLLVTALGVSTGTPAQRIREDRMETAEFHHVSTTARRFQTHFGHRNVRYYGFSLAAYTYGDSTDWVLAVSSGHFLSPKSEIAFKLADGTFLVKKFDRVFVGKRTGYGTGIIIGGYFSYDPPQEYNYFTATVKLTEEDLERLSSQKVAKLRVSDGVIFYDREFDHNQLGRYLRKSLKKIRHRLAFPLREENITDKL